MTKDDLVTTIKEHAGLQHGANMSKRQVEAVLATLATLTIAELRNGGEMSLPGIGKFRATDRKGRAGRNPKTGGHVDIPAKRVPKFMAYKVLKDELN